MRIHKFIGVILPFLVTLSNAQAATSPVVLELFTSQSCSSCPPADALLKKIAESDSSVLALSYHVDYWDYLSWKDTYSSPANTQRQNAYAKAMGSSRIFTPQLIVNGNDSVVGSDETAVNQAIVKAKGQASAVRLSVTPQAGKLTVTATLSTALAPVDIWEVRYDHFARIEVKAGENGGRTLESINNVTSFKKLATLTDPSVPYVTAIDPLTGDGIAILAQIPQQGKIIAAANYSK